MIYTAPSLFVFQGSQATHPFTYVLPKDKRWAQTAWHFSVSAFLHYQASLLPCVCKYSYCLTLLTNRAALEQRLRTFTLQPCWCQTIRPGTPRRWTSRGSRRCARKASRGWVPSSTTGTWRCCCARVQTQSSTGARVDLFSNVIIPHSFRGSGVCSFTQDSEQFMYTPVVVRHCGRVPSPDASLYPL